MHLDPAAIVPVVVNPWIVQCEYVCLRRGGCIRKDSSTCNQAENGAIKMPRQVVVTK